MVAEVTRACSRLGRRAAPLLGLLFLMPTSGIAETTAQCPAPKVLATFPPGTFLENILVEPNGDVLFTSYFDRTVLRYRQGEGVTVFAKLAVHPVGIIRSGGRIWLTAHGASFADGPAFESTNQLLALDPKGSIVSTTAVPQARFLNGLVSAPNGDLLIADSLAGTIWRHVPASGRTEAATRDPALAPDQTNRALPLGANGIKLDGRRLLVSNTSAGTIVGSTLSGRNIGPFRIVHRPGPVDDFYVAHGTLVAATHGARLISVDRSGTVGTIAAGGFDGSTATAPVPGRPATYAVTAGGPPAAGSLTAMLVEIPLGPCR